MISDEQLRDRLVEIAGQLLQRTLDQEVSWTETDKNDDYLYSGSNSSVSIQRDPKLPATSGGYKLTVFNWRGATVGELKSEHTIRKKEGSEFSISEPASWNDVLVELHKVARQSALNIEKVLDNLISDLRVDQDSNPKDNTAE